MTSPAPDATEPDGPAPLHLVESPGAAGCPVVLFHHRDGVDEFVDGAAARIAAAGHPVLVPDLFHDRPAHLSPEEKKRTMVDASFLELASALLDLAADRAGGRRPAAAGFCMGGRLAFLAAVGVPGWAGALAFYGGELDQGWGTAVSPIDRLDAGAPPLLLQRGSRDTAATAEAAELAVDAADRLGTRLTSITYAGARHAFMNPHAPDRFSADCAGAAWSAGLDFLQGLG